MLISCYVRMMLFWIENQYCFELISDPQVDWIDAHYAFTVETLFKIGKSVNDTQRAFHAQFKLGQNDAVLDRKPILLCINSR